jgi:hypothetical protein
MSLLINEKPVTEVGSKELKAILLNVSAALQLLNKFEFEEAVQRLHSTVEDITEIDSFDEVKQEDIRNELFVLRVYAELFLEYALTWQLIYEGKFSDSWRTLQNALDSMRAIRRYSNFNFDFFETQCTWLEKTYPYGVFFSIGASIKQFDCSICGEDIDSEKCTHSRRHLYSGRVASGIARQISAMKEISMVSYPEDKRCCVTYPDDGPQFHLVRYLANMLRDGRMRISDFKELQYSKRKKLNPDHRKTDRNALCYCGSGKKHKKCCVDREYIDGDHVDIIGERAEFEIAL